MNLFRHPNTTDILADVLRITPVGIKGAYRVKVSWYRIFKNGNLQNMNIKEQIWIKAQDWPKWSKYETH